MTSADIEVACRSIEADGGPIVEVVRGLVPDSLGDSAFGSPIFDVDEGRFLLRVPNGLRVLVEDGRQITIDSPAGLSDDDILLWITGSAWGALAYQRGLLPLHMSAIECDGRVVGFGGNSGAGKSTLAAALHQRGHPLFADDVTSIMLGNGDASTPIALPGHKTLKLWADAVERLGIEPGRRVRTDVEIEKFYVGNDDAVRSPLPISRLYMLQERKGIPDGAPPVLIEQRLGGAAVGALIASTYRRNFGERIMGRARMFQMLAKLCSQTQVYDFGRPKRSEFFSEAIDTLEAHFGALDHHPTVP